MKRKIDELEGMMSSVRLNKTPKIHNNTRIVIHKDVFDIGKLREDKVFYTREEVVELLNKRESILYTRFYNFLKNDSFCKLFIPKWIY